MITPQEHIKRIDDVLALLNGYLAEAWYIDIRFTVSIEDNNPRGLDLEPPQISVTNRRLKL